jgi:hypothetical protein
MVSKKVIIFNKNKTTDRLYKFILIKLNIGQPSRRQTAIAGESYLPLETWSHSINVFFYLILNYYCVIVVKKKYFLER